MDTVYLRGLRIDTVIGIHDWERDTRQVVVLDLELGGDNRRAAASDRIGDALDYEAIAARLGEYVGASEFRLIETLAEEVACLLRREFDIPWLRLSVSKPGAVAAAEDVGVVIERGERP